MQAIGFLSWQISPKTINEATSEFADLSMEDMKCFLIESLYKNLLYVPLSEINNADFAISEENKRLNKQFYSKERYIVMTKKEAIQLFEDKKVRTAWDDQQEKWFFSVVDVVAILTDSPGPKRYWSVLKTRIKKEGCEPTTICSTLKMQAVDGKMRLTDVADTEQLFRLIQSIPSPKAEPFKQSMAIY